MLELDWPDRLLRFGRDLLASNNFCLTSSLFSLFFCSPRFREKNKFVVNLIVILCFVTRFQNRFVDITINFRKMEKPVEC